jgi:hypothetical protein
LLRDLDRQIPPPGIASTALLKRFRGT